MGWLLVLGLKEGLVECAIVCVKSEVILIHMQKSWSVLRNYLMFALGLGFARSKWRLQETKTPNYKLITNFQTSLASTSTQNHCFFQEKPRYCIYENALLKSSVSSSKIQQSKNYTSLKSELQFIFNNYRNAQNQSIDRSRSS